MAWVCGRFIRGIANRRIFLEIRDLNAMVIRVSSNVSSILKNTSQSTSFTLLGMNFC